MWTSHLRFKGIWNMQDLYESIGDYFRGRKYKFHEKIYKHKQGSPFGAERQYHWHASLILNDVYHFWIDMYIHTYDAQDVVVKTPQGNTATYTKGRLWIEFNGDMNMYYDSRWHKNRTWANVKIFLNNYVKRRKHGDDVWDVLAYRELQRVNWLTRRRLKMEHDEYEQKHWMGVHA